MKHLFFALFSLVSVCSFAQSEDVKIDPLLIDLFKSEEFQNAKSVDIQNYKITNKEQKEVIKLVSSFKEFDVFVGDFSYVFSVVMNMYAETGDTSIYSKLKEKEEFNAFVELKSQPYLIGFQGTYDYDLALYVLKYYYDGGLDDNIHFKALKDLELDKYYSSYSIEKINVQNNYEGEESLYYSVKATLLKRMITELSDSSNGDKLALHFGGSKWVKRIIEFPFHFSDARNQAYESGRQDWVIQKENLTRDNHTYLFYGKTDCDLFYEKDELPSNRDYKIKYLDFSSDVASKDEVKKLKKSSNNYDLFSSEYEDFNTKEVYISNNQWWTNSRERNLYLDYEDDLQYQFVYENQELYLQELESILSNTAVDLISGGVTISGMEDFEWVTGGSYRYGIKEGKTLNYDYRLRLNQYYGSVGYNLLNTEYVLLTPELGLGWATKKLNLTSQSDSIVLGFDQIIPIEHTFKSWSAFAKPSLNLQFGYKAILLGSRVGYLYDFYGSEWNNGLNKGSRMSGMFYDFFLTFRIDN